MVPLLNNRGRFSNSTVLITRPSRQYPSLLDGLWMLNKDLTIRLDDLIYEMNLSSWGRLSPDVLDLAVYLIELSPKFLHLILVSLLNGHAVLELFLENPYPLLVQSRRRPLEGICWAQPTRWGFETSQ